MTLEENIQQLRDSMTVTSAQNLRREARLKDHRQWLEDMELAFARMAARDEIHSARMEEFDEKMTQVAAAQLANEEGLRELEATVKSFIEGLHQRGGNGHN
ncbi:MAG: hypothetical protein ABSG03_34555 [Bryobacteraceae bacterium]|jgi:hypothetical protein